MAPSSRTDSMQTRGLDRVAARFDGPVEPEFGDRRAPGQPELRPDDVHPGHLLGHRVLDLKPCVGLDEGERLSAAPDVDQELERPRVAVADAPGEVHRGVDDPFAQVVREPGRGRHLDDLLEVPLHAALALAEMGDGAVGVAEDLHLDVARPPDELLDVEVAVAEAGQRLRAAALVGRRHLAGVRDPARAAAPAAAHRLDHHAAPRAEGVEERRRLLDGHGPVDAPDDRHAGVGCRGAGAGLVAEQLEGLHARTDEGHPRRRAAPGQFRVLRQEAVAGMQGVAAGVQGRGDDLLDVEIRRRADAVEGDGLVRFAGVQGAGVVGRRQPPPSARPVPPPRA